MIQQKSFEVMKDERIRNLQPIMDFNGFIKVKTRIFQRADSTDFRFPTLLPSDHLLLWKLIKGNMRS